MILPQTYSTALFLLIVGMVLWGSWANTLKLTGKWRFELYYFDFAFGLLIAAVILAFTVGNLGFDGFSVMDDLSHAGKRQWFYGFVAGIIFNFANMLLTAGISVAGMAVAFPVGIGLSIIVGTIIGLITQTGGNPGLQAGGSVLVLIAAIVMAAAYSMANIQRHEALARAGKTKTTRRPSSIKGVIVSAVSGLLMAAFYPMVQKGMAGDIGLGPYAIMMVFAVGVFISTFVFNIFFMNLSVEGDPVEMADYFKTKLSNHFFGLTGGMLWMCGAVALLVGFASPVAGQISPVTGIWMRLGFPVLAGLWGLLAWREFRGSDVRARGMAFMSLLLFGLGVTLIALAPLYIRHAA